MLSSRMAHPELTGLVTLAFIIIFGPILYDFNVETVKVVSDYHEETNGSDEVLTISSCFWAGVLGGVASVLYIYIHHLAGSPEDAGTGAQEVQLLPGAGGRGGGLSGGGAGLGL